MNEKNKDKYIGGFTEVEGYFKSSKVSLSGWRCPTCKVVELAQDLGKKVKRFEEEGIKYKVFMPKCNKCGYVDYRKVLSQMTEGGVVV